MLGTQAKPDPLAGTRLFSAPKGWLSGDPVGSGVADFLADHGYPVLFGPIFSCWRYLLVEPDGFRQDIASLLSLIDTNVGLPEVISKSRPM